MKSNILETIFEISSDLNIPTVILGGLALPAYNVARTTLDIDICIYVTSQEKLDLFLNTLKEKKIISHQNPKIQQDLFVVFGLNSEAEIWLKPCDSFDWDEQMVKKIEQFFENVYVLSIEDFILTKLARMDRSSIDISDVLQVLIANKDIIDWKYLKYRLEWKELVNDFKEIMKSFNLNDNLREISEEILKKYNNS